MSDQWGVGNAKAAKAFASAQVGKETVDLIFGEHPHSRSDNNIYARWPDGRIEGFDGHQIRVDLTFTSENYLKTAGLSGNEVRKAGNCTILFNDKPVYSFFYRDINYALTKANHLVTTLLEFSVRLWDVETDLIGRKIYYHRQPATVVAFWPDQGAVLIQFEDGYTMPRSPYDIEDGYDSDWVGESRVKDDLLSAHIWWYRK